MASGRDKHAGGFLQQRGAAEDTPLRLSLQRRDVLESTNLEIKQLIAQGAPEGIAVSAREQRGGYGRQGRSWASPRGGLYLSLLLRPALHGVPLQELPTLSLALGLAVRDTLASHVSATHLFVKWPNDVVCAQGKLCGISLEGIDGAACAGIGINVFPPNLVSGQAVRALSSEVTARPCSPDSASETASDSTPTQATTSLPLAYLANLEGADLGGADREQVLTQLEQDVLDAIARRYAQWCEGGFAAMQEEFESVSYLTGKAVRVLTATGDEMLSGQVCGVSRDGMLLVLDAAGKTHAISSGEAHIQFPNT